MAKHDPNKKSGGGNRKKERNRKKCAAYRARHQREKNRDARARRIRKGFRVA